MAAKDNFTMPCSVKPEYNPTMGGKDKYPKKSHATITKVQSKSGVLGTPPGNMKPSAL